MNIKIINKIVLSKIDKKLLVFSSIFMMITSLISVFLLFLIINEVDEPGFLVILTFLISLFTIGLTLWTNSIILSNLEVLRKREVNINLIICLIQSFYIYMDGFRIKYVQGLECVFFLFFDKTIKKVEPGVILPTISLEFVFSFLPNDGTFIGVNIIALIFLLFFIYIRKKYFNMPYG